MSELKVMLWTGGTSLKHRRIFAKVKKIEGGCWLWMGHVTPHGYGRVRVAGSKDGRTFVHRWVYETLVGAIPAGKVLDHLCRVKNCVNPAHLEPVTDQENILRGIGPSAVNAKKTHCSKGHEFTEENTRMYGTERACIACHKVANLKYSRRKAAA